MTRKSVIRCSCWLALLAPMVVSSSGAVEPTYEFYFEGFVLSDDGTPLANYAVAALRDSTFLPSGWGLLESACGYRPRGARLPYVTLSDEYGRFRLTISLCHAPDSLAVGVVFPATVLVGPRFHRLGLPYGRKEKEYSWTEAGFLCDNTVSRTLTEAYIYDPIDTLSIVVPDSLVTKHEDGINARK